MSFSHTALLAAGHQRSFQYLPQAPDWAMMVAQFSVVEPGSPGFQQEKLQTQDQVATVNSFPKQKFFY